MKLLLSDIRKLSGGWDFFSVSFSKFVRGCVVSSRYQNKIFWQAQTNLSESLQDVGTFLIFERKILSSV